MPNSFESEAENNQALLVTGVGKVNMAAAMVWANKLISAKAYLNVGIAGHGCLPIGEAVLINQVKEEHVNTATYPGVHFQWKKGVAKLMTVNSPSSDYDSECMFDMEGSAFFDIASRFVSVENVQLLKIVSDNKDNSYQQINADQVAELVEKRSSEIDIVLKALIEQTTLVIGNSKTLFDAEGNVEHEILSMHQKWHISVSMEAKLRETYKVLSVMNDHSNQVFPDWKEFDSPKAFLKSCQLWLNQVKPRLSK